MNNLYRLRAVAQSALAHPLQSALAQPLQSALAQPLQSALAQPLSPFGGMKSSKAVKLLCRGHLIHPYFEDFNGTLAKPTFGGMKYSRV
jgi:hypothetical protein